MEGGNKSPENTERLPVPRELRDHVTEIISGSALDKDACLEKAISDNKFVRQSTEAIVDYLNCSIVVDDFDDDHQTRREWRRQHPEHEDLLTNNKLKGNKIQGVIGNLALLQMVIDKGELEVEDTEEIRECIGELFSRETLKNWGAAEGVSVAEKVAEVRFLSDRLCKILSLLTDTPV